jgi:hypothetical protein
MGSSGASSRSGPAARGIGCRVGKADIALPFASVGQIVEYTVFPLPLARPYIGGVGLHEERPLVSVALARGGGVVARSGPRLAKGIRLETGSPGIAWALEVDELGSFLEVTLRPRAPAQGLDLPPWISQATAGDGRTFAWIDVPAMVAHLRAGQPS